MRWPAAQDSPSRTLCSIAQELGVTGVWAQCLPEAVGFGGRPRRQWRQPERGDGQVSTRWWLTTGMWIVSTQLSTLAPSGPSGQLPHCRARSAASAHPHWARVVFRSSPWLPEFYVSRASLDLCHLIRFCTYARSRAQARTHTHTPTPWLVHGCKEVSRTLRTGTHGVYLL